MQHAARFFSTIFSPLLMPTYGVFLALWVSILCYLPVGTRLAVLLVVFGITCVVPMIFIAVLHSIGVVKDKRLVNRKERWLPYIFIIMCYMGASFYLIHVHAPLWLTAFMWGGGAAAIVSFAINFVWKISAHMAGIGGVVALLSRIHIDGLGAFEILWLFCVAIVFAGVLGTSRMQLERHTFWQVMSGFACGFLCVYLASALIN
ncbi:MAG: hypothetical protein PHR45_07130 [Muribaculaceae bacterium]|nr:hypothetical protein [Muribaculaceae bacterium]